MSMKKVYKCDICRDEIKNPQELFGIHFTDMKHFSIAGYARTDGVHICFSCAKQLKICLSEIEIENL